jgi:chorismate mutase / prephenate dehydratase
MTAERRGGELRDKPALDDALVRLRTQIEQIDQLIVRLLARRLQLARDTGVIKRAGGLPLADRDRERAVLERVGTLARAEGVSDADVRRLFMLVIKMARAAQDESE